MSLGHLAHYPPLSCRSRPIDAILLANPLDGLWRQELLSGTGTQLREFVFVLAQPPQESPHTHASSIGQFILESTFHVMEGLRFTGYGLLFRTRMTQTTRIIFFLTTDLTNLTNDYLTLFQMTSFICQKID